MKAFGIKRLAAAKSNVGNAISFTQTQDGYLKKIAKAYDEAMKKGPEAEKAFGTIMEWEVRHECCSLLGWGGTMACTPWGPPAPAAYSEVR